MGELDRARPEGSAATPVWLWGAYLSEKMELAVGEAGAPHTASAVAATQTVIRG